MDPNNPVVKLCAEGMQVEDEGRIEQAQQLFLHAWEMCEDDFDACIAAHFVARHRAPQERLHWNQLALRHADAVNDERVYGFYPSLYLNMGWSHEQLGELAQATNYYKLATVRLDELPDGASYTDVVRKGIAAGQARLAQLQKGEVDGKIYRS
jgi:tetratricopeptide (TPR) repeat protein